MRRLVIDGFDLDFDEKTAIGIDIQCTDLKEPGERKLKTSNSFSVPPTMTNKKILGIVGGVQSNMDRIYKPFTFTYYQGNETIISGVALKIDSIGDRISMSIVDSMTLFDKLKLMKGRQMFYDLNNWLIAEANSGVFNYPWRPLMNNKNLHDTLEYYANTTNGVHFPFVYGQLYEKQFENIAGSIIDKAPYDSFCETEYAGLRISYPRIAKDINGNNEVDRYKPPIAGCHFYIYAHTFLQFLQSVYQINIGVGYQFDGNAWEDSNFKRIIMPLTGINLMQDGFSSTEDKGYYFDLVEANADLSYPLDPLSNVDTSAISAYEILMSLTRMMSATIDYVDGNYLFRRLDELEAKGKILNWTGKIDAKKDRVMKPMLPNYAQKSYVKYEKVEDGVSALAGAKTVVCNNLNLKVETDLFKVKGYVPMFGEYYGTVVPLMTKTNAYTNPCFLVVTNTEVKDVTVRLCSNSLFSGFSKFMRSAVVNLKVPAVYSLSGEFKFLDKVNHNPKFYQTDLWLNSNDIRDLDNFTMVYLQELNGMFYVNKISGWNTDKSKSATSVELIRISDRTPVPPADLPYFVDGQNNIFTDGKGNYFY